MIGRIIDGRYQIQSLVAIGGMGRVYKAEQSGLGRTVAVKVLAANPSRKEHDPLFRERFALEAATASRLTSPNTITIFHYGRTDDDIYFIVMEFVEGITLGKLLKREGRLSVAPALTITRQVCLSLREAHARGIVHRDIKPSNIMLVNGDHDQVKVLDFGIARQMVPEGDELDVERTSSRAYIGTPEYMAPESFDGKVDPRSDVYSVGVVLYVALTGRLPFKGPTATQTILMSLRDPPPAIDPAIELPPALEDLIFACLEKEPERRPSSIDDLLQTLQACLAAADRPAPSGEEFVEIDVEGAPSGDGEGGDEGPGEGEELNTPTQPFAASPSSLVAAPAPEEVNGLMPGAITWQRRGRGDERSRRDSPDPLAREEEGNPEMVQFGDTNHPARMRLGSGSRTLTERCVVRLGGEDARVVTVVRLLPDAHADPATRQAFLGKAQVLLDLREPTIPATLTFGRGREHFVIREFIEGLSLRQLLERSRTREVQVPPPFACQVVLQQCKSLLSIRRTLRERAPAFARSSFAGTLRSIVIDRDASAHWVDPLGLDNPGLPDARVADPAEDETRALLALLYELCTGRTLSPAPPTEPGRIAGPGAGALPEELLTLSIPGLELGRTSVTGLGSLGTNLTTALARVEVPEPTWMEPLLVSTSPRTPVPRIASASSGPSGAMSVRRRGRAPVVVGLLIAAVGALGFGLWLTLPDRSRTTESAGAVVPAVESGQTRREPVQPKTQRAAESPPAVPPAAASAVATPLPSDEESAGSASTSLAPARADSHHARHRKEPSGRTSDTGGLPPKSAGRAVEEDKLVDRRDAGAVESDAVSEPVPAPRATPEPAPPPVSAPPKTAGAPPAPAPPGARAGVDRAQVKRVVAAHMTEIGTCYERARVHSPRLAGTVTIRLVLAEDGQVASADVASDTTASPLLQGCLSERIRSWKFPAFGRRSIVTYPFRFE